MTSATRALSPKEQSEWSQKLNNEVGAKPLVFERAEDANAPFQISVTNGQAPGGKTLVIQLIKRPDISAGRAVEVAQHALIDVFGRHAGAGADLEYMDAAELKKRNGTDEAFVVKHDSLTIIFQPGPVASTRRAGWVRSQMAAALNKWHEASMRW